MLSSRTSCFRSLLQWDKDVSYLIYRSYNSQFDRAPLLLLELSGHGIPWIATPILIFVFKRELNDTASSLILNFLAINILDLIVIGIVKPVFHRPRPVYNTGLAPATIQSVDQFSFPSGHATRVAFIASFLYYSRSVFRAGLHPILLSPWYMLAVFIWATAVSASRVALGRHHVLDVIIGAVLGASYIFAWIPFWLSDNLANHFRRLLRHVILGTAKIALVGSTSSPILTSD